MDHNIELITATLTELGILTAAKLNPGASNDEISGLEQHLGQTLPQSVKNLLAVYNGQQHDALGIAFGARLLSIDGIKQCWDHWLNLDDEALNQENRGLMESDPVGVIKPLYTNPHWIPVTDDGSGNFMALDFDPDIRGTQGQIISCGIDEDVKCLVASDFEAFLENMVTYLKNERWTEAYLD
ncbi:SMI1/KNR4 family protein [Shewanella sp. NFH-SH190041]|uniref:SMI1/KNR4 family protein n=1 Tax=Shewanella sp. NFH-SH190041 TaxID=2950245 RepID=UPI0021C25826|nr:SMI1/KNR4 family protein [Shewanella sp. NFH-SH190041]BDM65972.1 SMI1/KNR4 family protein [Shewanella sp. NFH-SH190041]